MKSIQIGGVSKSYTEGVLVLDEVSLELPEKSFKYSRFFQVTDETDTVKRHDDATNTVPNTPTTSDNRPTNHEDHELLLEY